MPSNMFFTVTLPATLWFFDKQKVNTERKDKILFIDARNTYHQIDRAHREWKEEHIQNLTAIVRLYRGENERYLELVSRYIIKANEAMDKVPAAFEAYHTRLKTTITNLQQYASDAKTKLKPEGFKKIEKSGLLQQIANVKIPELSLPKIPPLEIRSLNDTQLAYAKTLAIYTTQLNELDATLKTCKDTLLEVWTITDKQLKIKNDKDWISLGLNTMKPLEELQQNWKKNTDEVIYYQSNIDWLQSRFPDAKYADVVGLCKVADKAEYVDEQDYSMNAGRYVGVDVEVDNLTKAEFKIKLDDLKSRLIELNSKASSLMDKIESTEVC
jgi:type I restriction enzyme M protein